MRRWGSVAAVVVALVALLAGPARGAPTGTGGFAPVDRPSPPLTLRAADLAPALACPTAPRPGDRVVLLVHGTAVDPAANWAGGYLPALAEVGFVPCTVAMVAVGMGDAQVSVERVVHAIRTLHAATGRPIQVVGYSQGGIVPRFALRFFPELRPMVEDLVTLSATNNGALFADGYCLAGYCQPAGWQQRMQGSSFVAALNSGATTFPGVDITSVYTRYDEIATPNLSGESSHLAGATNIAVQDVCPLDLSDHLVLGTVDAAGYRLVLDALLHDGPAVPDRLPASTCSEVLLPGVDVVEAAAIQARVATSIVDALAAGGFTTAEPELKCWVTGDCTRSD